MRRVRHRLKVRRSKIMDIRNFNYELPERLIAQDPLADRSASRLMVMKKQSCELEHRHFSDIIDYLKKGDCLVLNDTKVIPARLYGVRDSKDSRAKVEILLLKRLSDRVWQCLVKPGKKCRIGDRLDFGEGLLKAEIINIDETGNRHIEFEFEGIFEEILDKLGEMPLPPYITHKLEDKNRYQTVYAKYEGSAAAPTAGLHFTKELLEKIEAKGVDIAKVTLHVGLGTFRPVKEKDILKHHMHSEFYMIDEENAAKINAAKERGARIICVGTTSCRALESAAALDTKLKALSAWTDIFIYPGYKFKMVDALITNFHLPESTLIMLVSALAGREEVLNAYREAVDKEYRFFSFGDAMLII